MPFLTIHSMGFNAGFSRAVNVGISLALEQGADVICLLNQML